MIYGFLTMVTILFAVTLRRAGLLPLVGGVLGQARAASSVLRSREMEDAQKAAYCRSAARAMAASLLSILWRMVLICAVPLILMAAGCLLGLFTPDGAWQVATAPAVLFASSAGIVLWLILGR